MAVKIGVFPDIGAIYVITKFLLNKHLQYKSHLAILQSAKPGYKSQFLLKCRANKGFFGKKWVKASILGQKTRFLIFKLRNLMIFSWNPPQSSVSISLIRISINFFREIGAKTASSCKTFVIFGENHKNGPSN